MTGPASKSTSGRGAEVRRRSAGSRGLTAVRLIADRALDGDVPTVLLHVGDFDRSGESIFEALAADAAAFVSADKIIGTQKIVPVRVALPPEQVAEHDLPTAPPKKTDSRSRTWRGETWQLEALAPDVLAALVDYAIWRWFDGDRFSRQRRLEQRDRGELVAGLPRGSM